MSGNGNKPCLDVVSMLRDEFANIHGPLPDEDPLEDLDSRLRAFYAHVHALPDGGRSALCLSGGGIRSASFSLGIMQALADKRVLERFHYLSTVSGGGYIGSWLTAWIHRHFTESPGREPTTHNPPASLTARFLPWSAQKRGISNGEEGAEERPSPEPRPGTELLREMSQLLVSAPEVTADERRSTARSSHGPAHMSAVGSEDAGGVPRKGVMDSGVGLGGDRPPESQQIAHLRRFTNYLSPRTGAFSNDTWTLAAVYLRNLLLNWLVVVPLLCAVLAVPHVVAALLGALIFSAKDTAILATILVPAGFALAALAFLAGLNLLNARSRNVGEVEKRARWEGAVLRAAACWVGFAAIVLYATDLLGLVPRAWHILLVAAGGLSGAATYLFKRMEDTPKQTADSTTSAGKNVRLATTAAALVTIVLILAALAFGVGALTDLITEQLETWKPGALLLTPWFWAAATVLVGALTLSAVFALLVDVNEFSLHALYRNRLVRAFLRASRGHEAPHQDADFDAADDIPLGNLWPKTPPKADEKPEAERHLFHVIDATLNDVAGSRPEWNERKGVSFTFSPLHYGAHVVRRYGETAEPERGYRRLPPGDEGWLTLGTAMTISGAAANPNMGYHSSPVVAFLMALFNVRLGWWLLAPWNAMASGRPPRSPATAWRVWCGEALGTTRFGSSLINVSDGGHFDNLGLYEMVRRRCRYIVVVDAGQDRGGDFESLGEALRKIRVDFGVPITLTGLDLSDPKSDRKTPEKPPVHAWHGTIHYSLVDRTPDGDASQPALDGELVYFKPVVSGDESVDIQAYRRFHRAFPNESTVDQWFSESQFESYRKLGEHSVRHLLDYYEAIKGMHPTAPAAGLQTSAGRSALQPPKPETVGSGLSPREFCHCVGESLSLMKRHQDVGSHAGGVVYRMRPDGDVDFLLVKSNDHTYRVLPKGHIEPWEDAMTTAVREVREEAAFALTPERSLGAFRFETPTRKVTTTYFLMRAPTDKASGQPHEGFRDPQWFTIKEARKSADLPVPPDVFEVLERARTAVSRNHPRGTKRRTARTARRVRGARTGSDGGLPSS